MTESVTVLITLTGFFKSSAGHLCRDGVESMYGQNGSMSITKKDLLSLPLSHVKTHVTFMKNIDRL